MNFQNFELGRGFCRIENPMTVSTMNRLIRLAFMMKLKTMAI
jgi:hypothetical protein